MAGNKMITVLGTSVYFLRTMVRISAYVVALALILKVAFSCYDFGFGVFANKTMAPEGQGVERTIVVEEDDTVKDVAKSLKKLGLIESERQFLVQERFSNYKDMIRPGTYVLRTDETADEMLAIMSPQPDEDAAP